MRLANPLVDLSSVTPFAWTNGRSPAGVQQTSVLSGSFRMVSKALMSVVVVASVSSRTAASEGEGSQG